MNKNGTRVLFFGLIFCLGIGMSSAAPVSQPEKKETKGEKIFIPKNVKAVLLEGLPGRQTRSDIPFTVFKHIYLPASSGFHNIFFFKLRNADLGFMPLNSTSRLKASFHIFLQFHLLENNASPKIIKEIYVPANVEMESASYDPNQQEIYNVGYPLMPGNYLLAMAVTSLDLKKIGTYYFELSLPEPRSFEKSLDTSPIFFVNDIQQVNAPEMRTELHKDFFSYSLLHITPNIDGRFHPEDSLDIFFYIFGARPNERKTHEIEIKYEVLKFRDEHGAAETNEILFVQNWNWSPVESGDFLEVKGEVKNLSDQDLNDIEAVVTFFDTDGISMKQKSALIEKNPLPAGQGSPFKIIDQNDPAIKDAELDFQFKKGEKIPAAKRVDVVKRYEACLYNAPLISQMIPLKQVVLNKSGAEGKKETRNLTPGNYALSIKIVDRVTGKSVQKEVQFTVE
ncbi:MAG: FxLYD domain-containing protein [Candidatus Aminicenantales bacterium]